MMDQITPSSATMRWLLGIIAAAMICIAAYGAFSRAKADGPNTWSGCGAGLHGGLTHSDVNLSGPIAIGETGQTLGAGLFCDVQMKVLVLGAFLDYDRRFGNIVNPGSFGLTGSAPSEITVGGRVGVSLTPGSLAYAHAGRAWDQFGGALGNVQGWKYGGGIELKLSPVTSMDVRYSHTDFDNTGILSGLSATNDEIRIGLNFRFGPNLSSPSTWFVEPSRAAPLK